MINKAVITRIQKHLYTSQQELTKAQALLSGLVSPDYSKIQSRYPSFKIFSRQDKGEAFAQALQIGGFVKVNDWKNASFILSDHDQRGDIRRMQRDNKPFFIHPHSARSMILWDGIIPTTSFVRCNFVFAPGQKEVMLAYGYRRPIEVVGWTYCPIKPFTAPKELKRILFAPIHPNVGADAKGRKLMEIDKELNRKAFEVLKRSELDVTVRYYGSLQDNGLVDDPSVTYSIAELTTASSLEAIEEYDLIVSHQTFAYLAIASGKPTVMFGEDTVPHSMNIQVRSWDKYKRLLMYPLDLLTGNPRQVLEQAACNDKYIKSWKDNFIGEPFDSNKFVKVVETYLG